MHFYEYAALARAHGPLFSFELFPPKTAKSMENLKSALPDLLRLQPHFVTVTYGAGGSTQASTFEIAAHIRETYRVAVASHLTCVGASRAQLDEILHKLSALKIENIVALRGDPPQGDASFIPAPDGYRFGSELVAHIRRFEDTGTGLAEISAHRTTGQRFGVAVGGYPEKHIEAVSMEQDLLHLKRKVEAGADLVITQLFYDNADYFAFVARARALGITIPIVPGLLPILSVQQIERIAALCGAKIPAPLREELNAVGDDADRATQIGIRQSVSQARELLERGVPGIHFYVLNRYPPIAQIMSQIRKL